MPETSACVPPEPPLDLHRSCDHLSSVNHPEGSMNEPPGKIERRLARQNSERRAENRGGEGKVEESCLVRDETRAEKESGWEDESKQTWGLVAGRRIEKEKKKMKGNEMREIGSGGENKSIIKMTRKEERERGCWMVGGGKCCKREKGNG